MFFGYTIYKRLYQIKGFLIGGCIGALAGGAVTFSESGLFPGLLLGGILGVFVQMRLSGRKQKKGEPSESAEWEYDVSYEDHTAEFLFPYNVDETHTEKVERTILSRHMRAYEALKMDTRTEYDWLVETDDGCAIVPGG